MASSEIQESCCTVFDLDPCYRGPGRMTEDHNCIPVRRWIFWRRWVCVNCDRTFKVDTR